MARLPTVGGDSGDWGNVLNEFLGVSFNSDGTAKTSVKTDIGLSNVNNTSDATKDAATATLTNKTVTAPLVINSAETQQTLTDGANINWDMNSGGIAKVTLGGNRTMNAPTNIRNGATYILEVIQDGTGSRTITWNAAFVWSGATAPTLTTTATRRDIISFVCSNGVLYGSAVLNFL